MPNVLRVLILTQYYPPETGAPQARLHELAQRLVARGIKVQVLTAMPNYPTGKIFPDYRGRWIKCEEIDGISVVRVPIYPTNKTNAIARSLNYFSFVFTSILPGIFLYRRPDIILTESPPLFLGASGVVLAFLRRTKLVLNVSDLWPESIVRLGALKSDRAIKLLEWLERRLYCNAHAITGQAAGIVEGVRRVHPDARIALIPNGCDCAVFQPSKANRSYLADLGWENRVIVGYAGLIGLAQGIRLYVQLAQHFRDDLRIGFVLVGEGPEYAKLKTEAASDGLNNIVFLGRRPKTEMPGFVAGFDLSLVPLARFIPGALPSKIYELMASETPVVLAAKGDAADLIQASGGGVVVPYGDLGAVAATISKLAAAPDRRRKLGILGRAYVKEHHDRDVIVDGLERFLRAL